MPTISYRPSGTIFLILSWHLSALSPVYYTWSQHKKIFFLPALFYFSIQSSTELATALGDIVCDSLRQNATFENARQTYDSYCNLLLLDVIVDSSRQHDHEQFHS